jgi:hypothetical protein
LKLGAVKLEGVVHDVTIVEGSNNYVLVMLDLRFGWKFFTDI